MDDSLDAYRITRKRNGEIRKFQDKRREAIFNSVQLTPEQIKEIDDLYLDNYGEKIPYTWHRHYTAFTGRFDPNYFPELLFIPEFEQFMNPDKSFANTLSDKNFLPLLAKSADVVMPRWFFRSVNGCIQNADLRVISMKNIGEISGEFFLKPTKGTDSGKGCQVLELERGEDKISGKTAREILFQKGGDWVLQERLRCHSSINKIYPDSVNTFRIMTYYWNGKIRHAPVIMRIGKGGNYLDNAHAGGIFIALDDDGRMHETAFTEFNERFTEHPDTHMVFQNYKIDLLPEVIEKAAACHAQIPQLGCIHWDFTLNEAGKPTLIEANIMEGSIWLFEMAHGKGLFGELTPEILRWMKEMKGMKKSDRLRRLDISSS